MSLTFRQFAKTLAMAIMLAVFISPAKAAHDHDHIYVTIVDYLGYQKENEHYVVKVKRVVEGEAYYYYLHFVDDAAKYLKGHEGERLQISLDGKTWARAALEGHPVVKIHEREDAKR